MMMKSPFKRIAAWRRARRERKAREERLLALIVALTSTMPGNPDPPTHVQQWVNRTLKRRVF